MRRVLVCAAGIACVAAVVIAVAFAVGIELIQKEKRIHA
jgi:hypothetical protein